jgi:hypothetical protein
MLQDGAVEGEGVAGLPREDVGVLVLHQVDGRMGDLLVLQWESVVQVGWSVVDLAEL